MAEKKIGDRTFKCDAMLAFEALKLQARLMKVIGGALDKLPAIIAGTRNRGDPVAEAASDAAAVGAFGDIFMKSDSTDIATLVKNIVEVAEIKGSSGQYRKVDLDGDFTDHLADLVPVVVFVLQVQFKDFFSAVLVIGNQK